MQLFWAGLQSKSSLVISEFLLKRANLSEGEKDFINVLWSMGSQKIWIPRKVAGVKDPNPPAASFHVRTEGGMNWRQLGPEMSPVLWNEAGRRAADQDFQKAWEPWWPESQWAPGCQSLSTGRDHGGRPCQPPQESCV